MTPVAPLPPVPPRMMFATVLPPMNQGWVAQRWTLNEGPTASGVRIYAETTSYTYT